MDDILLLQPDPRASAILTEALNPLYRIKRVKDIGELERLLPKNTPQVCVLDAFDCRPPIPLSALRHLRRKHPGVALVVASDFSGREIDLYHLGRMSVDGVIRMEEAPVPRDVRAILDGAIAASLAQMVTQEVARDLPTLAQEAIRWTIEHAEARTQVTQLAAALALSPRAFHREMKAMDLATPRSLLLWGRLVRASRLLESSHQTVESVAFHLGYATGGTLSKALKRHVGCSPTALLQQGGLALTLEVFRKKGFRNKGTGRERWANAGTSRWRMSRFVGQRR